MKVEQVSHQINKKLKKITTMGRPKLTTRQVSKIKERLSSGKLTHTQIAKIYKVSRECITKINTGMKDPLNKNGRWSDVE